MWIASCKERSALGGQVYAGARMHIDDTTHEHGSNSKVYTYQADYDVDDDSISWTAEVRRGGDQKHELSGSIPLSSPGVAAVAEQAVRDAVVTQIDSLDDATA